MLTLKIKIRISVCLLALFIIFPVGTVQGSWLPLLVQASGGQTFFSESGAPYKTSLATYEVDLVTTGYDFACGLTDDGGVKCWGKNTFGQLGDGTDLPHTLPVNVSGLTNGVIAISAGYRHTCALTTDGDVKCWGYGYLGNGKYSGMSVPVTVSGWPAEVVALSVGSEHTCVATTIGEVWCWGKNSSGQLGDGTLTSRLSPVKVAGFSNNGLSVNAGYSSSCAITATGGVKCWGANDFGQLGDGSNDRHSTPVDVTGLSDKASSIDVGTFHTCALLSNGAIQCWGKNASGQLGNGTLNDSSIPVSVVDLTSSAVSISAGESHSCSLLSAGNIECWGENGFGQLGNGTVEKSILPVEVGGLPQAALSVSAGYYFTCAGTIENDIYCWGRGDYGQLGNGYSSINKIVVDGYGFPGVVNSFSVGSTHSCAVLESGKIVCWGTSFSGQLGNGDNDNHPIPVYIQDDIDIYTDVDAGSYHTCGLTNSGTVKCWGANVAGELGNGSVLSANTPVAVNGLPDEITSIGLGEISTCAVTRNHDLACWGWNLYGQLGTGDKENRLLPTFIDSLAGRVEAVAAGSRHTCATTTTDEVYCWGDNTYKQLGIENISESLIPAKVTAITEPIQSIDAGWFHTCGLVSSGSVKCWGGNVFGQLGNGTNVDSSLPVEVVGLSGSVQSLGLGYTHSCILTSEGGIMCWGNNERGMVGDGTGDPRWVAGNVFGLDSGMKDISSGNVVSCALGLTGQVKCWGDNFYGQFAAMASPIPIRVFGFSPNFSTLYFPIVSR